MSVAMKSNLKIDAHQHFWQPLRGDYDWMPQDNLILNRAYGPSDLKPSLERHGIDGTVRTDGSGPGRAELSRANSTQTVD